MKITRIPALFLVLVLVVALIVYYQQLVIVYAPSHYKKWTCTNISKLDPESGRSTQIQPEGIVSEECQTILNGDYGGISQLRNKSDFPWRETDTDSDILELTKHCQMLKSRYRFPPYFTPNVTDEELDFPIAYSLLAHTNVNQILILISAIYREHNIHCIHVDRKSPPETFQAILQASKCFPNVFVSTVRVNVIYAHVSRLLADIACMKDLVQLPSTVYNWKYLINLCSQDFPTRTNLETVRQLKELQGFNSIGGYTQLNAAIKERTLYVWEISNSTNDDDASKRPSRTKTLHSPPPFNMTITKNLAYNFYTRKFLQWALFDSEVGLRLLEWSKDTYSPDEHFWLMLHRHPDAPGGSKLANGYQLARRILWGFGRTKPPCHGEWRHGICVLGAEDVCRASKTGTLFINKFDVTLDSTGPTCLRQLLDERSTIPNETRNENNKDKNPQIPPKSFFDK